MWNRFLIALSFLAFIVSITPVNVMALNDGLCRTPPMGWNSWNWFGCNGEKKGAQRPQISDSLTRAMADAMVSSGMKDAGYEYVNLDDCWGEASRDSRGGLVPRRDQFPQGMKATADYVHSKGLKIGVYSDVHLLTCAKTMPGAKGHEQQDADSLVKWGIDYLKHDYCGGEGTAMPDYRKMRDCLKLAVQKARTAGNTQAKDLVYSVCNWGQQEPWLWADSIGHLWRVSQDMGDGWEGSPLTCCVSVMYVVDQVEKYWPYAKPGAWNDPDMLQVGNQALTTTEAEAHFSLWCIMAAPLIAGNDLGDIDAKGTLTSKAQETKRILTNAEVIAVDQDTLGCQGRRVKDLGSIEIWAKKLINHTDPDYAVLLFNRGSAAADITVSIKDIGIADPKGAGLDTTVSYYARDLWSKTNMASITNSYTVTAVPSHGVKMFQISKSPLPHLTSVKRINVAGSHKNEIKVVYSKNGATLLNSNGTRFSAELYNLKGIRLFSKKGINKMQCDFRYLGITQGIYFIKVFSDDISFSDKIILR